MTDRQSQRYDAPMPLQVVPALHRATHQVALYLDRLRNEIPVTQAEAHVLTFLAESRGACSLGELHRSFGHKRSTLTGIVDRLVARGLVERNLDPQDRRSFRLQSTAKGRTLSLAVKRTLERLERAALRNLSPSDLKGFLATLEALEKASNPQ